MATYWNLSSGMIALYRRAPTTPLNLNTSGTCSWLYHSLNALSRSGVMVAFTVKSAVGMGRPSSSLSRIVCVSGLPREAPDAAHRRLIGERELRQREVLRHVLEHHPHALADGDVVFLLGAEVRRHQIRDEPDGLVLRRRPPLLVQLHQHHGVGGPLLEARLDGVRHDLVGVDVAASAHLLPRPLERPTPRTAMTRGIPHELALAAGPEHQPVVAREPEVLAPLPVGLRHDQVHPAVLDGGHAVGGPPPPPPPPGGGGGGGKGGVG